MRWLRFPLLHFLAGGAALFWLSRHAAASAPIADTARPVVVTAADVEQMRAAYTRETGLAAGAADEIALIDRAIDEELLFREALARGLDRNDRSVRNWLIEQMRVLSNGTGSDDELFARAQALELDRKDLVVRRMLVQKMRLLASRLGEEHVDDADLRAFYVRHRADYQLPERVSLWHVFVAADGDHDGSRARAEQLVAEWRAHSADPSTLARRGDAFPVPPHLVGESRQQLEKLFGAPMAGQIMGGIAGTWLGPLQSSGGAHLFWIERLDPAAPPSFEAVRARVVESWREERREARLAQLLREVRTRYPLRVDSAVWRDRRGA